MRLRNISVFFLAACVAAAATGAVAADGNPVAGQQKRIDTPEAGDQLLYAHGNPVAGKQKRSMCEGCHGIPMYRTAYPDVYSVPKLGGQHAAYIVKALHEYQSKQRSHPSMLAIAASLTEQDMADLAAYYSSVDTKTSGK
jgi:cytochrome c553